MNLESLTQVMKINLGYIYNDYNSEKNCFNKHKNTRKMDLIFLDAGINQKNAFALYDAWVDKIIITTALIDEIIKLFSNIDVESKRADWMLSFALNFCLSHEFAHLYTGHCQLCKKNSLSIGYSKKTGLSYLEHQTLEIDADAFAACRVAEKMMTIIDEGTYLETIWKNENSFYADCFQALCGLFYIFRHLDGNRNLDFLGATHPPAIIRYLHVIGALNAHSMCFYNKNFTNEYGCDFIKKNDLLFSKVLNRKIFVRDYDLLSKEMVEKNYEEIQRFWRTNLKNRLRGFNRVPFAI